MNRKRPADESYLPFNVYPIRRFIHLEISTPLLSCLASPLYVAAPALCLIVITSTGQRDEQMPQNSHALKSHVGNPASIDIAP